MSTQGKSSDAFDPVGALRAEIIAQTEAIRADEQQKQAVESVLLDLHRRIEGLEKAHEGDQEDVADTLHAIHSIVIGVALELRALEGLIVEMMASAWGMDRDRLSKLHRRFTEQAFKELDSDGKMTVEVKAERDATVGVSKDTVGRDKSEQG